MSNRIYQRVMETRHQSHTSNWKKIKKSYWSQYCVSILSPVLPRVNHTMRSWLIIVYTRRTKSMRVIIKAPKKKGRASFSQRTLAKSNFAEKTLQTAHEGEKISQMSRLTFHLTLLRLLRFILRCNLDTQFSELYL